MNRGTGPASAMFFYAMLMVGGGVTAYALAPAGANATTALAVPVACAGVMVVCAMLSLQIERVRGLGKAGVYAGLVFSLLFAAVIGMRAFKTGDAVAQYKDAEREYATALEKREVENGAAARTAFFAALEAPDHDKSYLRNTLWFLTLVSVGSFGMIFVSRPRGEGSSA